MINKAYSVFYKAIYCPILYKVINCRTCSIPHLKNYVNKKTDKNFLSVLIHKLFNRRKEKSWESEYNFSVCLYWIGIYHLIKNVFFKFTRVIFGKRLQIRA